MEIKPLSKNVISKICSFSSINNITHCVTELVLNSLDAKSSAIAVRVNTNYFRIQIVDNGTGISQENMENIAHKHFTSKCCCLDDLYKKSKTYGYKGESLWNISHISKTVNITSKCSNSDITFSKNIMHGRHAKVEVAKHRQSNGTTVTVDGLFDHLPVRQKRIKKEYELDDIVSVLESLSIINPQVSFSLRNDFTGKLVLKCQKHDNVIHSLIGIYRDIKEDDLTLMKVGKDKVKIDTLLLKEITNGQIIQQIFVNKRPALFPVLHKLLCHLLQKSENKNVLKGNTHPLFIMNVKCPLSHYNLTYNDSKPLVEFNNFDILERCVEKMVSRFLGKPLKNTDIFKHENKIKSVCGASDLVGAIKGYGFKNWLKEDGKQNSSEKENQFCLPDKPKENCLQQTDKKRKTDDCTKPHRQKILKPRPLPIEICELKNKTNMTNEVVNTNCYLSNSRNKVMPTIQNDFRCKLSKLPDASGSVADETKNEKFMKNYQNLDEKLKTLISKKDMNATLFSNFTDSENKGKDVIMYMFLKSTELFSNDNEHSERPCEQSVSEIFNNSNETIIESNIFFENIRKTATHRMNKTVSISVKLKQRRNKSPEETINIQSNATFTCTKPKRQNTQESSTNLKSVKSACPSFDRRKRNFQPTEYAVQERMDKNVQTTFFEESKAEFCTIPNKKFKYLDSYRRNFYYNPYQLQTNERKTNTEDIFEYNLQYPKSFHFKSPSECDEMKFVNNFGKKMFQVPANKSLIFNNVNWNENDSKWLSDWNKSRIFHFEKSGNNYRKINTYKKLRNESYSTPILHDSKKLHGNFSSTLNHSILQYADNKYSRRGLRVNLEENFDFENLSVSPIPKYTPISHDMEISTQIQFNKENFPVGENNEDILPFRKCSTQSFIPYKSYNRNGDNVSCKSLFRRAHTEPIPYSKSFQLERVKRNIDKLFLEKRSIVAQNQQKNYATEVVNELTFSNDSLDGISTSVVPDKGNSLWKKFIDNKKNQKYNSKKDSDSRYLAKIIKTNEINFEKNQTPHSDPTSFFPKLKTNMPLSPDLFTASRRNTEVEVPYPKIDLTYQPNSQPSCEVGIDLLSIEEGISLNNKTIAAKDSELPTLTAVYENSPTDLSGRVIEVDHKENNKIVEPLPVDGENAEWVEKPDHQGNKFYFNTRTGMTSFTRPKLDEGFNIKLRFEFIPKGLSPVLMQDDQVDKTISPNSRIKLRDEILKSYENELDIVKWEKYFKENEPRKFFDELYKEKRNDYETEVPDAYQPVISRSIATLTSEYRYSKALFDNLEIIGQLDQKFIATVDTKQNHLILFDQHAVHERIRLEYLVKEYDGANTPCENITLFLIQCDIKLLKHHEKYLNTIGLYFKSFKNGLTIYKVPLCLYNKVKKESKQNSWNLAKSVELLVQEILKQIKTTRGILAAFPKTIHEIINLEACRGAIKFGECLSELQMKEHIRNLSQCLLPFQCAHGRPTLMPILNLTEIRQVESERPQLKKLSKSGLSKQHTIPEHPQILKRLDRYKSKYFEF